MRTESKGASLTVYNGIGAEGPRPGKTMWPFKRRSRKEKKPFRLPSMDLVLAHLIICCACLGLAVAMSYGNATNNTKFAEAVPNGLLMIGGLMLLHQEMRRPARPWILGLLFAFQVAGIIGVYVNHDLDPTPGLLDGFLIIIRGAVLFWLLPACTKLDLGQLAKITLFWFWIACWFLNIEGYKYAQDVGISIYVSDRFNPSSDWLQANQLAAFAGGLMLCSVLQKQPFVLRLAGLGLGTVVLLITQSRGIMLATAVAFMVMLYMMRLEIKRYIIWAYFGAVAIAFAFTFFSEQIAEHFTQLGQVQGVIDRTEEVGDAGRSKWIAYAIDRWNEKPIFGFGYKGGTYQTGDRTIFVENTVASVLMESGAVGCFFYVFSSAAVLYGFWSLGRKPRERYRANPENLRILRLYGYVFMTFVVVDGLTERIYLAQLGDSLANATSLWAGFMLYVGPYRALAARRAARVEALPASTEPDLAPVA